MLCRSLLLRSIRCSVPVASAVHIKNYCDNKIAKKAEAPETKVPSEPGSPLGNMARKYIPFREEDAEEILDVNEERLKYSQLLEERELEDVNPFQGLNLERGRTGVFEIEDLVQVLQMENAEDIFVAKVPAEIRYVDYICIVSGKSQRHMQAIIEFVRRVYKQKRHGYDRVPLTEGAQSKDWMALDLGSIALHVFSKKTRPVYDLESLWAVGPEYDRECNKKDAIVDMLEKHSVYLHNLQPAS